MQSPHKWIECLYHELCARCISAFMHHKNLSYFKVARVNAWVGILFVIWNFDVIALWFKALLTRSIICFSLLLSNVSHFNFNNINLNAHVITRVSCHYFCCSISELKQATFLTTRTLTRNKIHVFNQSQFCFFTSWRPYCQKRRLLTLAIIIWSVRNLSLHVWLQ